ncbi:hypothetical protein [Massilia sp. Se16.2.3]|uniref:hypothetical protein n=1 Tax=Massilia sp. Se16.2.3 TaxID=2709303 RepID=UPI001E4409EE|nr:hypothetical protein [Massilia sp. Se16.2.3]
MRAARLAGAFSGAIRPNFVALLDAIGMQRWLGIASCASLFDADAHLVQIGAILRHPIFVDGKNYSGTPGIVKQPFLREQVLRYFAHEARQMPDALYIPMGASVAEGLDWLAREGVIKRDRILHGLPHPSGANAERVAYFLGRKDRAALSVQDQPAPDRRRPRHAAGADGGAPILTRAAQRSATWPAKTAADTPSASAPPSA